MYVDDIRNAPDESWSVARTVNAAIHAIKHFEFDEISLDHDISHQVVVGGVSRPFPCEETFVAVAEYIAEKFDSMEAPKITLHTSNPVGAKSMGAILWDRGIKSEIKPSSLANRLEQEV